MADDVRRVPVDAVIELIRRVGVKAGVAPEVYGAMCHELRHMEAPAPAAPAESAGQRVSVPSINRLEISLDGSHACALFGENLHTGEAVFVKIEGWPNATHKQEQAAMRDAYELLCRAIGERLPFDIVRHHAAPTPAAPAEGNTVPCVAVPPSLAPLNAWLLEHAPDCGDNSCLFGGRGKGGMRTNGGCRCFKDVRPDMRRIFIERMWAALQAPPSPQAAQDFVCLKEPRCESPCGGRNCHVAPPSHTGTPEDCPIADCVAVCSFPDNCSAPSANMLLLSGECSDPTLEGPDKLRRILDDLIEARRDAERLNALIDALEVYGTPEHPMGVTIAVRGFPRYGSAREAIDAALPAAPADSERSGG